MKLSIFTFNLKLKDTFRISREATDSQPTLVVALETEGHIGFGEATTNSYYGNSISSMRSEIERCKGLIESANPNRPAELYSLLKKESLSAASRCAVDMAANDLYGKLNGAPLYSLWGWEMKDYPITNYTIGIAEPHEMIAKMKAKPWPVYKIKLGTEDDVALVKELRKHTDAVFRIDANCAWTPEETIQNAPVLKELGVEFLEQPLPADDWEGMEWVQHRSVLPIIADESCVEEEDVEKCALHFNGINIKLVKCGGLTPALRMIEHGRELGLKIMVGCMTESTVGISAVAQLLPRLDYVDMDGALLLAEDIAEGVSVNGDGSVSFPDRNGTGVALLP